MLVINSKTKPPKEYEQKKELLKMADEILQECDSLKMKVENLKNHIQRANP